MEANPKGDGAINFEDDAKDTSMAKALEWPGLHTPKETAWKPDATDSVQKPYNLADPHSLQLLTIGEFRYSYDGDF